jgi:ABC-type sugar transport system substrate-binding protein
MNPRADDGTEGKHNTSGRKTTVTKVKGLLAASLLASTAAIAPASAEDVSLGFVTHAQGNPFIQQIIDGAQAAAKDLGIDLAVAQQPGSQAEGQLKLAQNFANAGAQGVATSIQGEGMVRGLNELVDAGVKIVQFNTLSTSINAPYVGEKSVESGRVLGRMIVEKLGGADATGTVILGICFPGIQVLENRSQGVQESLKAAAGLNVLGPYDVKVSEVENYNRWQQLYAANPDAVAMIGLCAPDIASLGKLNAENGDKFVAGGYDLTEPNLKAIQDGHAYVSIGQSAFVQGYLPIALMADAIKNDKPLEVGFYDAGAQIVTADSVDMGNGLPAISFEEAIRLAGDPAATTEYYKAWSEKVLADPTAGRQPIEAEAE